MRIINCSRLSEVNKSLRKYYNFGDIRLIDVIIYGNEEKLHSHKSLTEILFVLEGSIIVTEENKNDVVGITKIIDKGNSVMFLPGERHKVEPREHSSRILVIKYIRTGNELLELFSSDWEN